LSPGSRFRSVIRCGITSSGIEAAERMVDPVEIDVDV
jgi:hypothetical protein